ncbi:TPA: cupin domain-containing protein [Candidatus Bipolaricaulota bacterium]|nr:cupin domain-containing protein [Candidatus Bipolaricaulota bacterium]
MVDLTRGIIEGASGHWVRHLSEMREMYQDQDAVAEILETGDPLIYEVYEIAVPEEEGQLLQCVTIIQPGKVGSEYYMTKGHYHKRRDRAEVYLCLSGRGYLLLQTEEGDARALELKPGTAAYVPPFWAHRTVNVDDEPLVFYGAYPADAGHDYKSVEEQRGFSLIVREKGGKPVVEENPCFRR